MSVRVVRRLHEALKQLLLEAVFHGIGFDRIRGFQSWFFGGRGARLRQSRSGHGANPLPLFSEVIIIYLDATIDTE